MSRAAMNWLFFTPLVIVTLILVHPALTGGSELIDEPVDVLGLLIALSGLAIRAVSRDWKLTHSNGSLVTSGPYSVVRHPMYLGSFTAGIGVCTVIGNLPLMFSFAILFIVTHALVARREERLLSARWPDEYRTYSSAVPACVPAARSLGRAIRAMGTRLPSIRHAVDRELSTICAVIGGIALVEAREDYVAVGWPQAHMEIVACLVVASLLCFIALARAIQRRTAASAG